jgi:hypothetical protein
MTYDYARTARRVHANMDFAGEFYSAMNRARQKARKAEQAEQVKLLREVAHLLTNFDLVLDMKKSNLQLEEVGSDQVQGWAYLWISSKNSGMTDKGVKAAVWDVTRIDARSIKNTGDGWLVELGF